MRLSLHKTVAVTGIVLLLIAIVSLRIILKWGGPAGSALPGWEMKWSHAAETAVSEDSLTSPEGDWIQVSSNTKRLEAPKGTSSAWIRITLPDIPDNSAVLIEKVYGEEIKAYVNDLLIYSSKGTAKDKGTKVLIPLSREQSREQLYLWSSGGEGSLGIEGGILSGSYSKLLALYVKQDVMDLFIGASLIFMAAVFAVCSIFLKKELFISGLFLVLVILSCGTLVITNSPFLPILQSNPDRLVNNLNNLALITLLISSIMFFEKLFGPGKNAIVTKVRKFIAGYTLICCGLWILNLCLSYRLDSLVLYVENMTGGLIVLQLLFLLVLAVIYALRGQVNGVILSGGFAILVSALLTDLVMYYVSEGSYHLYWWKWGAVVLVISLIVIVGRGFIRSHEQVVRYSFELEKFNNDLQRSEKMEIISELAASVAQEVQNPLHVTRGFLQILGDRSEQKEKAYLEMAITELDRAALIITDFLTFAKPELESVERLDVSGELKHIAGVLAPLANLREAEIILKLQAGLYVEGSSSKMKQAFINILKNSVESLQKNGLITITVWQSSSYIIVCVRDNGEGMKSSELTRLGEPYYSNKSKGTGLGLMVTFKIIEAMGGTIKFHSQLGEGTEVIVKLPVAGPEEEEVLACV
ncbi:sensor histidine kinase [Paenibacillus wynnii]|uniref:sensor histidine kinase n=1 Tax=Paenibacillus wynnii TaxID=268407 RepID=UPI00278DB5A3|nr:HAMP domain-containing sensor histidine kinase [Paenibacillus wynnii]MDQ0193940.1 signal transduction histidine kinase [Paenibacillus wynnii]